MRYLSPFDLLQRRLRQLRQPRQTLLACLPQAVNRIFGGGAHLAQCPDGPFPDSDCVVMLDNLNQDYARTARAKGLADQTVVVRHVLRNALVPVVTLIALQLPTVFTGAVVTEQIFRVPGIGSLLISSIQNNDTPVIMAIVMLFAVLVVLFTLVADLLYGVLDPRVRYG